MPITFSCTNPECPRIFSVKDDFAGRTSKCPDCGTSIIVPAAQATSTPIPMPAPKEMFCTNCGNATSEQAVACMSCGAKPIGHKKFCRQCGVALNPEQVVCVKCGAKIDAIGGFQSFINNAAEGLQSLGKGANQSTASGSFPITLGEKLIFGAIVLAVLSMSLPWIYLPRGAHLPPTLFLAHHGIRFFYDILLVGVFIFPGWMVARKKRTKPHKIVGYGCAGIGLFLTLIYKRICISLIISREIVNAPSYVSDSFISDRIEYAREMLLQVSYLNIGAYLFILACIVLIVGIALIDRN